MSDTERNNLARTQVTEYIKQQGFDNVKNLAQFLSGEVVNKAQLSDIIENNAIEREAIQQRAREALEQHAIDRSRYAAEADGIRANIATAKDANERAMWESRLKGVEGIISGVDAIGKAIGGDGWLSDLLNLGDGSTKSSEVPGVGEGKFVK